MSYNSVGPGALRAAVKVIIDTCTRRGVVCSDPRSAEDPNQYVPYVTDGAGLIHGIVIESGSETDPTPNEEHSYVLVALFLQYQETRVDGLSSIDYFDAMIAELKAAFKAATATRLGFTTPFNVKQDGLYAPDGYSREQVAETLYHFGPMQILVKQRVC